MVSLFQRSRRSTASVCKGDSSNHIDYEDDTRSIVSDMTMLTGPTQLADMPISALIANMEGEKNKLIEQMSMQNTLIVELSEMIRGDRNMTFMATEDAANDESSRRLTNASSLEEQAVVLELISSMQSRVNRMEKERDNLFRTVSQYESKMKELEFQAQAQELKIMALEQIVMAEEDDDDEEDESSSSTLQADPVIKRV